jgi:hypothetical protein
VEGDPELACPWVADAEGPSSDAPASIDWNILQSLQISFSKKEEKGAACLCVPGSLCGFSSLFALFL